MSHIIVNVIDSIVFYYFFFYRTIIQIIHLLKNYLINYVMLGIIQKLSKRKQNQFIIDSILSTCYYQSSL